jgi:hypothetical protein
MKTLLSISAAAVVAHAAFAEVKLTVGDISDKRTTGKFFSGLEVELKLTGPELLEARGIRTVVKSAMDDTGKKLPEKENRFVSDGFEELKKAFGGGFGGEKKENEFQVKLEFGNPPRSAKAIKTLSGSIELLIPQKDPASVVSASFAKDAGKPLENPVLKAAGVELTLRAPGAAGKKAGVLGFGGGGGENDLGYEIKDPNKKVASMEFFDAAGKKLESNGRMSSSFGGAQSVSHSFNAKPPADAVVKIYVVTDKSVITVPLELKDIPLP